MVAPSVSFCAAQADGEIDLRLAWQPPIVDDAEQKAGRHQPRRHLRVDAPPAVVGAGHAGNLHVQPRQLENPMRRHCCLAA